MHSSSGANQHHSIFTNNSYPADNLLAARVSNKANIEMSERLRIPERSGHLFQKYPATHSDFIRPLIPEHPATL